MKLDEVVAKDGWVFKLPGSEVPTHVKPIVFSLIILIATWTILRLFSI